MVANRDGVLLNVSIDGNNAIIVNHSRVEHWGGDTVVEAFIRHRHDVV